MKFINRHTIWISMSGLLVCLIGLSLIWSATLLAEEQTKSSTSQNTFDKTSAAPEPTDPNSVSPADPNSEDSEENNEDDIFDLDPSSLSIIYKAYSKIFTPELVTDDGRVRYSTLKRKRFDILDAERELKDLNPAILMSLSKNERIAFWINTYNFCTIQVILRHYPIEPKFYMIIYPDNSIMQITGAWTREYFEIQQLEYNLQEIEQDFLLKRYKDPRICFALSNASMGGAILRNEPYQADRLEAQLNDQVKQYLDSQRGLYLDKENEILYLSNLFQMHKATFLDSEYASIKKFRNRKDRERAWLNFILPYLSEEDIQHIETVRPPIKFIEYDWHLNEAP